MSYQSNSWAEPKRKVEIKQNRLHIDAKPQPFLYGAELQYFRLRGGHGKNISADKVHQLWRKALGQMRLAGMNTLSFYIPWDFHEYSEGKFDFTGSVDEDGDGRPDYPSRNVVLFMQMARQYGFKRIMVRPGPFINAEWGFLGFGAIPSWFHEKYPDAHMRAPNGKRTKLYEYHHPNFLKSTKKWFQAVYDQVLKPHLGDESPIVFLQIDNETNFMWQSLYNQNYEKSSIERFQKYLQSQYLSLHHLNQAHGKSYGSWSEVTPPTQPGENLGKDGDWYRFNDWNIFTYLQEIRQMWEEIGIKEPQVLFTLAESYNAPENGLLPNFAYRASPQKTGMMTVNLYPKTYESGELFNLPFKSDLDVKSMVQANKSYIGDQEWLLGPELQTGWWRGTHLSEQARLQTYLTTIGHGLKGLFVYYFSEGQNWDFDWGYKKIKVLYEELASEQSVLGTHFDQLSSAFWQKLQARVDDKIVLGLDAKTILSEGPHINKDLYFDAPLDAEANPRPHFRILEELGRKVVEPYGDFLSGAVELSDEIGLLKDIHCHAPSRPKHKDNVAVNSDWAGGLLGFLLQTGYNPQIIHTHLFHSTKLNQLKVIFRQDCGVNPEDNISYFKDYIFAGGLLINFVERNLFDKMKERYHLSCESKKNTETNITWQVCSYGKGFIIQVSEPFYYQMNSNQYSHIDKIKAYQKLFIEMMPISLPDSYLSIVGGGDRTAIFGRVSPLQKGLWITIKTSMKAPQRISVRIHSKTLARAGMVPERMIFQDVFSGVIYRLEREKGGDILVEIELQAEDSRAFFLQPMNE